MDSGEHLDETDGATLARYDRYMHNRRQAQLLLYERALRHRRRAEDDVIASLFNNHDDEEDEKLLRLALLSKNGLSSSSFNPVHSTRDGDFLGPSLCRRHGASHQQQEGVFGNQPSPLLFRPNSTVEEQYHHTASATTENDIGQPIDSSLFSSSSSTPLVATSSFSLRAQEDLQVAHHPSHQERLSSLSAHTFTTSSRLRRLLLTDLHNDNNSSILSPSASSPAAVMATGIDVAGMTPPAGHSIKNVDNLLMTRRRQKVNNHRHEGESTSIGDGESPSFPLFSPDDGKRKNSEVIIVKNSTNSNKTEDESKRPSVTGNKNHNEEKDDNDASAESPGHHQDQQQQNDATAAYGARHSRQSLMPRHDNSVVEEEEVEDNLRRQEQSMKATTRSPFSALVDRSIRRREEAGYYCSNRRFLRHADPHAPPPYQLLKQHLLCRPPPGSDFTRLVPPPSFLLSSRASDEANVLDQGQPDLSSLSSTTTTTTMMMPTRQLPIRASYREGVPMNLPEDYYFLNDIQCLIRAECVELFVATPSDIEERSRGKGNRNIALGQVGIRCKHCAPFPYKEQANQATCFPSTLLLIYEGVRNWQRTHLEICPYLPREVSDKYNQLKDAGSKPGKRTQFAKHYYAKAAQKLGLVESPPHALRFSDERLATLGLKTPSIPRSSYPKGRMLSSLQTGETVTCSNAAGSRREGASLVFEPKGTACLANETIDEINTKSVIDAALKDTSSRLVKPSDRDNITDFMFLLFHQLQICYFSNFDRGRQNRSVSIGFPGLQCRHCDTPTKGNKNRSRRGRYFPTSVDAMGDSSFPQTIHSHLLKCVGCPNDVKEALMDLRDTNAHQVSMLKRGSKKSFLRRVWDVLHGGGSEKRGVAEENSVNSGNYSDRREGREATEGIADRKKLVVSPVDGCQTKKEDVEKVKKVNTKGKGSQPTVEVVSTDHCRYDNSDEVKSPASSSPRPASQPKTQNGVLSSVAEKVSQEKRHCKGNNEQPSTCSAKRRRKR